MNEVGRLPDGTGPSAVTADGGTVAPVPDAKIRIGGLNDPLAKCWKCGAQMRRLPMGKNLTVEVVCPNVRLKGCDAPILYDSRLLNTWHRFDAYMHMIPTDARSRNIIERALTELGTILP